MNKLKLGSVGIVRFLLLMNFIPTLAMASLFTMGCSSINLVGITEFYGWKLVLFVFLKKVRFCFFLSNGLGFNKLVSFLQSTQNRKSLPGDHSEARIERPVQHWMPMSGRKVRTRLRVRPANVLQSLLCWVRQSSQPQWCQCRKGKQVFFSRTRATSEAKHAK